MTTFLSHMFHQPNLPKVHGSVRSSRKHQAIKSSTKTSVIVGEREISSSETELRGQREEVIRVNNKKGLFQMARTRFWQGLACVLIVYIIFKFSRPSLIAMYEHKPGEALPEVNVLQAVGMHKLPGEKHIVNIPDRSQQNQEPTEVKKSPESTGVKKSPDDSLRSVVCVPFKACENGVKICILKPEEDKIISKSLLETGTWDAGTLSDFKMALDSDSNLGVIDIGANLGTYSLVAASKGRPVVSVEACHLTTLHLFKSLEVNRFRDRITVVEAAIMTERGYAKITVPSGNVGGAYPTLVSKDSITPEEIRNHKIAKAVLLDDIVDYVTFQHVILKIDLDGEDYGILKGAERLFNDKDVKYIFTVFSPDKGERVAKTAGAKFLQERGYIPKRSVSDTEMFTGHLEEEELPSHIVWVKSNP